MSHELSKGIAIAGIFLSVLCAGFSSLAVVKAGFVILALAVPAIVTPALLGLGIFLVTLLAVFNEETLLVIGIAL
jgi:hypothetical protein